MVALAGGFYADREGWKAVVLFGFGNDGVEVGEGLVDRDGIHLASGVVTLFDELLEVAAGDLGSELVGDDLAGALFLFDPGGAGQGYPHGATIYIEADVDGVGMPGGYGHNVCSPLAVEVFAGPAVSHVEIFVHVVSVSSERF